MTARWRPRWQGRTTPIIASLPFPSRNKSDRKFRTPSPPRSNARTRRSSSLIILHIYSPFAFACSKDSQTARSAAAAAIAIIARMPLSLSLSRLASLYLWGAMLLHGCGSGHGGHHRENGSNIRLRSKAEKAGNAASVKS